MDAQASGSYPVAADHSNSAMEVQASDSAMEAQASSSYPAAAAAAAGKQQASSRS